MNKDKLTVGELVYKISGDMDNLKTELKKSQTEIDKLKGSMEKTNKSTATMTKGFKAAYLGVQAFIAGAIVKGVVQLTKAGAELDSLSGSFNRLSNDIGINANETLNHLRKLSAGTIADKDLMLSANRAMILGVAKNTDEFGQLMQIARLRAKDMGIETTQAFNDIVTGIGRGSPLILDNLGIIVKQEEAQKAYAASLGKTTQELTANEQREALKYAVLKNGMEQVQQAGEQTLTYSERLSQLNATFENVKARIGRAMLPAMEALASGFDLSGLSAEEANIKYNELSKGLYRVAKAIMGVIKTIETGARALGVGFNTIKLGTQTITKGAIDTAKSIGDMFGANTDGLEQLSNGMGEVMDETNDKLLNGVDKTSKAFKEIGEEFLEAYNADNFKEVDTSFSEMSKSLTEGTEETGASAQDLTEKIEALQGRLIDLADGAKKTREDLEKNLGETFKKFGEDIKGNFEETVTSLAQMVVKAEDEIKNIKDKLGSRDISDEERSSLEEQLSAQKEILKAREDFEERQAERITAIRQKLTDAGIDAEKSGIDNLLNVRSLEDQIEEERRLASLDEFTRFEETQARKLIVLTDSFIGETKILQEKISKQKEYEADLTAYLVSEDSKRLDNTDKWANATIAKYKEVADSLNNLLSTSSKIQNLKMGAISPATPATPSTSGNQNTTNNTTNNNVSAPVTINGQSINNLSAKEISAIMGFELSKFIR